MNAAPAPAEPDQNAQEAAASDNDAGDQGPLSKIELEGAEDGNVIATHHPKVPDRVKTMDPEKFKPRKHALKKDEVEAHMKKHVKRLKP